MGGGDLNTKKSWHPNTMKNQERVWKAEQQEAAEKRRLNELRREIDAERSREELKSMAQKSGVIPDNDGADKKLEWMYSGPSQLVNREEYLLGRTIDKTFEDLDAQEKAATSNSAFGVAQPKNHVEHECIPFSIRQHKGVLSNDQVDLARKLMEDPLMLIKQKEMESRQKLLQNPVKLKELHRLLKSDRRLQGKEEKDSKSKAKKSKKSKKSKRTSKTKRKKSRKGSSSDSSFDSDEEESVDLDQLLAEKYKKVQHSMAEEHPEGVSIDKLLTMKYEKLSKELDKMGNGKKKKKGKRHRHERNSSSRSVERSNHRRSRSISPQRHKQPKASYEHLGRRSDPSRESKTSYKPATFSRRSRSRSKDKRGGPSSSRGYPRQPAMDRDERRRETSQRNADRARSRSRSNERRPRKARSRSNTSRTKSPNRLKTKQRNARNSSPSPSRSDESSSSENSSTPPRQAYDSEEEKRMKKVKNFGLVTASGQKLETKAGAASVRLYNREEIKAEQSKQKPTWSKPTERKRPLTEEELEEKRRAMMDNARWREKDRANNVKRYEAEDHREDARHGGRDYDKEFATKQFKRAAASETVESRIRSNRNNIQRSSGAMDSNFAKR
ncbi:pre-mRNA-splicing factor CWC25 homolog [Anopheles albimanus]|uniref:Cir_N domain-containing protein n=1 Tax=Anopheles albimanus TaxID=7167 RepID=A0A182F3Y3_ANOAL|nr:pre-mRNA-splicing factor CWC25 homolog [Anopheles albimanus]XP_035776818.1 pre-mRNA-splicing factor CWC25 homolog [Anopheles albimanus]